MAFCKIEVFCFPSPFSLSVRVVMEKFHCVLPSCCHMNGTCVGFVHQGMENVVIKVPVSLFSHLTEHMVEGGFLDLDHWCKSGLLLMWDYWNPDQNYTSAKREEFLQSWMLWQFIDTPELLQPFLVSGIVPCAPGPVLMEMCRMSGIILPHFTLVQCRAVSDHPALWVCILSGFLSCGNTADRICIHIWWPVYCCCTCISSKSHNLLWGHTGFMSFKSKTGSKCLECT